VLRAGVFFCGILAGLIGAAILLWRSRLRGWAIVVSLLAVAWGFITFVVLTNPLDNWP
jgi:hypothetical protein